MRKERNIESKKERKGTIKTISKKIMGRKNMSRRNMSRRSMLRKNMFRKSNDFSLLIYQTK